MGLQLLCCRSRWRACTRSKGIEWGWLSVSRSNDGDSVGGRRAELCFGAFDAIVRLRLLPVVASMVEKSTGTGWTVRRLNLVRPPCDRLDRCAHGRRHTNRIRIVAGAALDSVSRRQEGVKALNEGGVTGKKFRDAVDDARRVDASQETSERAQWGR